MNFAFLAKHDEVLLRHAALAERYVFDDPNAALLKLRQFGELLARHAAARAGLSVEDREPQQQIIDRLWSSGVINPQVSQIFHGLRRAGNLAAHEHIDDRREALHQLQMARKLAVWFHKAYGGDRQFQVGPFVPPPNPQEVEAALQDELERLRDAEVQAREAVSGARAQIDEHQQLLEVAQRDAEAAYRELETALELAAESEQQLQQEREDLLGRLAELQAQVAAEPAETRKVATQHAMAEAAHVELDEAETRRLIDTQLREAGWEADSDALRHSRGTRPVKSRNLAIAE